MEKVPDSADRPAARLRKEVSVTLDERHFARAYEAWLEQCSEVGMVTAADLSHLPMWREILRAVED